MKFLVLLTLLVTACSGTPEQTEKPPVTRQHTSLPDIDSLWNYSKPDETESKFREVLAKPETQNSGPYRLELLTQIARTQGLQGKFDEAHATLDEVEKAGSNDVVVQSRYLLERGRAFNSGGAPEKAEPLFLQAWELRTDYDAEPYAVDAAHMLAIVTKGEEALAWNQKALDLSVASKHPKSNRLTGALYNNIGWTYHDMGKFEEALDFFQRGWDWRKEQGKPGPTRIAQWSVGRALRSLGRVEEALKLQKDLEAQFQAAGETDPFVFEEIAECHMALGAEDEAKPYFAKAAPLLAEFSWVEPERIERARKLGGLEPK